MIDLLGRAEDEGRRQLDEAERLYELARKDDPYHTKWIAGLARVHLRQKDTAKFLADLAMIAANDADDLVVRKALAERTPGRRQRRRGREMGHRMPVYRRLRSRRATSCWPTPWRPAKKYGRGRRGIPDRARAEAQEAQRPQGQAGQGPARDGEARRARATLEAMLKADPEHPEARRLRKELEGKP